MKCKWWHVFFTVWLGERKCQTTINVFGAQPEIDHWYNEYKCHICKEVYRKHVLTNAKEIISAIPKDRL